MLAALAIGAVSVAAFQAPAGAQARGPGNGANNPSQCGVQNPAGKYPPGQCKSRKNSNNRPSPGQQMSSSSGSGSFDRGTPVMNGVQSDFIQLGTGIVDETGAADATFKLPLSLEPGPHNVVFKGVKDGRPSSVLIPFTLVGDAGAAGGGAAGGGAGRGVGSGTATNARTGVLGALPRTGSQEALPMAASGIALVVVGAGVVVAARRRRTALDASPTA